MAYFSQTQHFFAKVYLLSNLGALYTCSLSLLSDIIVVDSQNTVFATSGFEGLQFLHRLKPFCK